MNMTARDKKLLTGLGIFILLVLFGRFVIYPKVDRITTLKADLTELNNTYATNMIYKSKAGNIDSNIKILSVKLKDLRTEYPPQISIPELIMVIKNLSVESKLEVKSLNFQQLKAVSFKENKDNAAGSANTANASDSQAGTQAADSSASGTAGQQAGQQNAGADNISNPKIRNYFYLWGLKSNNVNDKTDTGEAAVNVADGKGYSLSVKIEAEGTNEQIKAFFTGLEKLDVKSYCKATSISKSSKNKAAEGDTAETAGNAAGDDNKLKLSAEIAFYGIMDKGAGGYYVLQDGKWNLIASADNKSDLFKEYEGYEGKSTASAEGSDSESLSAVNENSGNGEKDKEEVKSDFYVVASAFGGGFAPSVSIGCNNPNKEEVFSMPVAYGDNRGIENAEIYIEKRDGRFYCKFKTDHESYPDEKYSKTFEFIPEGKDLRLEISSSERNGEEDKAGINLNIINKTDLDLTYRIKSDDEKSPRVKIGKTAGSVRYEK